MNYFFTKRKNLIAFVLIFSSFISYSQDPTYQQTVEYLKTKTIGRMLYKGPLDSYTRSTGFKLTNINIESNGEIKLIAKQNNGIHDFDIVFNIFDLKSTVDYPDGVRAYKFLVHFQGLNVTEGYGITFATENDAIKVARAFRHLKKLCSQEDDLFGKPIEDEKKITLTKWETIEYIQNIIDNQGVFSYEKDWDGGNSRGKRIKTQKIEIGDNYYKVKSDELKEEKFLNSSTSTRYYYEKRIKTFRVNFNDIAFDKITISYLSEYSSNLLRGISEYPYSYCLTLNTTPLTTFSCKVVDSRGHYEYGPPPQDSKKSAMELAESVMDERNYQFKDTSYIEFLLKTEADAKRLKKAFEHLSSLINEEKRIEKTNDPFGE